MISASMSLTYFTVVICIIALSSLNGLHAYRYTFPNKFSYPIQSFNTYSCRALSVPQMTANECTNIVTAATDQRSSLSTEPIIVFAQPSSKVDELFQLIRKTYPNSMHITGTDDLDNSKYLYTTFDAKLFTQRVKSMSDFTPIFIMDEENYRGNTNDDVKALCKYDFFIPSRKSTNYQGLSQDAFDSMVWKRFQTLLSFLNDDRNPRHIGSWSHFLSLTYPSIDAALEHLPALRIGIDAYELRVDLLTDSTDMSIHRQIALLRDFSPLPIVYTVRTKEQLGKFSLEPSSAIMHLLEQGLRAGVEYLDVEACLPAEDIDSITNSAIHKYHHKSKLLGSLHVTSPQSEDEIKIMLEKCNLNGKADILKVVTGASGDADCHRVHEICSKNIYNKPYIGLALGLAGAKSRIMNKYLTPVTHKLMAAAAPGQLSVEELMIAREQSGLISPRQFYLFGTPIKQSMSPAMHNSAYQTLLLPHQYSLLESEDVRTYKEILDNSDFGGASVTIPHKESIMPMLDEVVGAAQAIGAVNTILIQSKKIDENITIRRKIGYNTDWIGMLRPIKKLLLRSAKGKGVGIVIGAGGTAKAAAYTIKQLGFDLVVCNRTPEKAEEIAKRFNGQAVAIDDISSKVSVHDIKVIISTVPSQAELVLPNEVFTDKPIVLDAAYKPPRTKLLEQALSHGCPVIQGATMLLEQGIEQFELWNERVAPREEMERAVFKGIERLTTS